MIIVCGNQPWCDLAFQVVAQEHLPVPQISTSARFLVPNPAESANFQKSDVEHYLIRYDNFQISTLNNIEYMCTSLYIIIHHYTSLYIIIHHYTSLNILIILTSITNILRSETNTVSIYLGSTCCNSALPRWPSTGPCFLSDKDAVNKMTTSVAISIRPIYSLCQIHPNTLWNSFNWAQLSNSIHLMPKIEALTGDGKKWVLCETIFVFVPKKVVTVCSHCLFSSATWRTWLCLVIKMLAHIQYVLLIVHWFHSVFKTITMIWGLIQPAATRSRYLDSTLESNWVLGPLGPLGPRSCQANNAVISSKTGNNLEVFSNYDISWKSGFTTMKTQIPPWIVGLTLIVSLSVSIFSLRPKCIIGSRFSSFSACQSGGNRFPPTKLVKTRMLMCQPSELPNLESVESCHASGNPATPVQSPKGGF